MERQWGAVPNPRLSARETSKSKIQPPKKTGEPWRNKDRWRTTKRCSGVYFAMLGIKLMVLTLLLAGCAYALVHAGVNIADIRRISMQEGCVSNIRALDGAKRTLQLEKQLPIDAPCEPEALLPYLSNRRMPKCPSGGLYIIGPIGTMPRCSLAMDSKEAVQKDAGRRMKYFWITIASFLAFLVVLFMPTRRRSQPAQY
jgi:hypothetical protein